MRRLTVAVMALGCLALVGVSLTPTGGSLVSVTLSAQPAPHPCTQACGNAPDHFAFCHVDRGGEGHVICPDSSSIAQHLRNHTTEGGRWPFQDECISDEFTEEDCLAKK
jgi:hypothetical protein